MLQVPRKTSRITTKKSLLALFVFMFLCFYVFMFVHPALAQEEGKWGLGLFQGRGEFVQTGAESVIVNVVMWMMSIIGIVAVAFVIYGGIMYATSSGNEQQIERAKKILLYAIIGLVIAILALTITTFATRVVRGGAYHMLCWETDPESGTTYQVCTPFETEPACREAVYYAQDQGRSCSGPYPGPCPSP